MNQRDCNETDPTMIHHSMAFFLGLIRISSLIVPASRSTKILFTKFQDGNLNLHLPDIHMTMIDILSDHN